MQYLRSARFVKTGLTIAYLFSALAITVATSSPGKEGNALVLGVTNYAVSSTCQGSIGDMVVRANSGSIQRSIFMSGQATKSPVNYRDFGFPSATVLMGVDQGNEKEGFCKVVDKQFADNPGFDSSKSNQAFYRLGELTTFTYQCNRPQREGCRIIVRELPNVPLEDALNPAIN